MCRVLGASCSGFYRFRQRRTANANETAAVAHGSGQTGCESLLLPRRCLVPDLLDQGHRYDRKTVAASMRRQSLRDKTARKYKVTANSKHNLPAAPNLLAQNFSACAPNQKWVSDITYLWTDEGWLYRAVIIGLFSRLVVGRAFSERLETGLVCEALQMAIWRRNMPTGVILHSDRGSQRCSNAYQNLMANHQIICIMSGKGSCCGNACAESFFRSLKV